MFCLPLLTVIPESLSDWTDLLKIMCILALGIFSVGAILRALVGRGSPLTRSISAVLNLILIYLSAVVGYVYLPGLRPWLEKLPFLSLSADHFYLLDPTAMPWELFYTSVLQMSVLALFVNMLESWLPSGRRLISWYALRLFNSLCAALFVNMLESWLPSGRRLISWYALRLFNSLCALALFLGFHAVADTFVPQFFGEWAKWILLIVWGGILLIAVLKLILSAVLTVLHSADRRSEADPECRTYRFQSHSGGLLCILFLQPVWKSVFKSDLDHRVLFAHHLCPGSGRICAGGVL